MEKNTIETTLCHNCKQQQAIGYKFCSHCGFKNLNTFSKEIRESARNDNQLKYLLAYIFIILVSILAMAVLDDESVLFITLSTIVMAIVDFSFALLQPNTWKYLRIPHPDIRPLIFISVTCIISAFIVGFSIERINLFLFSETSDIFSIFYNEDHGLFYAIILMALFPAIFEELAFRGFVFNNIKVLTDRRSAIIGSAVLFALVHFSMLSIVWLFPFGLLLAHLRDKHNTIIYGIAGHFIHNTTVILLEYYNVY